MKYESGMAKAQAFRGFGFGAQELGHGRALHDPSLSGGVALLHVGQARAPGRDKA